DPNAQAGQQQILQNVKAAAEQYGRVFFIGYDISGYSGSDLVGDIERDWQSIVDGGSVASDRYLSHKGRPLVCVYGFGFPDRPGTPDDLRRLINWFHADAPAQYRASFMDGGPASWNDPSRPGSDANPAFAPSDHLLADVISPWTVGRYVDYASADAYQQNYLAAD